MGGAFGARLAPGLLGPRPPPFCARARRFQIVRRSLPRPVVERRTVASRVQWIASRRSMRRHGGGPGLIWQKSYIDTSERATAVRRPDTAVAPPGDGARLGTMIAARRAVLRRGKARMGAAHYDGGGRRRWDERLAESSDCVVSLRKPSIKTGLRPRSK